MKLKAVLTDLDGTLINSIPLIMASDKAAIEKFGFKVTHHKLRELSQLHSRDIAYYLMDSTGETFNLFDFVEYRRSVFIRLLRKKGPRRLWFRDSKRFLEEMSSKLPVVIVTGSRKRFIEEVFDKKTRKLPKFIVTSDDVEHKKPDIEPLALALKRLKAKPNEVVFVGDSIQDAIMCRRMGVMFVAKIDGISTENQLRRYSPVFVAKTFDEVKRFVELIS